ncbi:MAG TPA: flavodoxin family protein [Spirochaetota bacterium]|nr:flavodoxin family protein [Spirochaetota bacterium]
MAKKILGFNCSPRKGKTTCFALDTCLNAARTYDPQLETELIELGPLEIKDCRDCGTCRDKLTCSIEDDFIPLIEKLRDPDLKAIVIASPVYMGSVTGRGKALLDRTVMFRRNNFLLKNKVGGVIAVGGSRNGGQELTIQGIQAAMLIHNMIVVSDAPASAHFGAALWARHPGGIEEDKEGIQTARNLGRKIAEIINRMNA